jgi:hypothetical protein
MAGFNAFKYHPKYKDELEKSGVTPKAFNTGGKRKSKKAKKGKKAKKSVKARKSKKSKSKSRKTRRR